MLQLTSASTRNKSYDLLAPDCSPLPWLKSPLAETYFSEVPLMLKVFKSVCATDLVSDPRWLYNYNMTYNVLILPSYTNSSKVSVLKSVIYYSRTQCKCSLMVTGVFHIISIIHNLHYFRNEESPGMNKSFCERLYGKVTRKKCMGKEYRLKIFIPLWTFWNV